MGRKGATVRKGKGAGKTVPDAAQRDPTGRRQEILDVALGCFAERGFQGTSVREIARAVGVNEATLYHYFPCKAAILDAIIDGLIAERQEVFAGTENPWTSLRQALEQLALRSMARLHSERERSLLRLMMIEGPRLAVTGRYPFLRLIHESGQRMTTAFEQLMATGRMRRGIPRLTALQFLAPILIFAFHQHGLGGMAQQPIDEEEFVRAHVDLFVRALSPHESEDPGTLPADEAVQERRRPR